MNKEIIEKKLKTELELFKIYSFFLIGLITGISTIIIGKTYTDKYVLYLLISGTLILVVIFFAFFRSYFRIIKLTKQKNDN